MECLRGRWGYLAMLPPGVETVVNDKPRQVRKCGVACGQGCAIGRGVREHHPSGFHRSLLHQRNFMLPHHLATPGVDLLVDVDLDGTYIGATPIERRGERQPAELPCVEGGIDDQTDGTGVGRSVTQTAAAPVHRT